MKRITAILVVAIIIATTTSACQPTPDHEIIQNKSETVIGDSSFPAATVIDSYESLSMRYAIPNQWIEPQFSKTIPYDTLTVNVDAVIHIPETDHVGIYTATFDVPFTESQQKGLVLKYLGDKDKLTTVEKNGHVERKWQIEESIIFYQKEIERANEINDSEMRDVIIQQANESLQLSMESYKDAPFDWEHSAWDGNCLSGRGENAQSIQLYSPTNLPDHYRTLFLSAYSLQYKDETSPLMEDSSGLSGIKDPRSADSNKPQNGQEEAASELALKELNDLNMGIWTLKSISHGLDGFVLGSELLSNGYIVQAFFTLDGLPFYDFYTWHGNTNLQEEDEYSQTSYNQYLPGQTHATVGIRDGRLAFLSVEGLENIQKCMNENVKLLSFSEISKIFCEQIGYHYYTGDPNNPNSGNGEHLYITDVYLSMMRVRKKDSVDEFYVLPVWDFVGYMEYDKYPFTNEELEQEKDSCRCLSFLTINAIDGTIIDRNVGY